MSVELSEFDRMIADDPLMVATLRYRYMGAAQLKDLSLLLEEREDVVREYYLDELFEGKRLPWMILQGGDTSKLEWKKSRIPA